MKKRLWKRAALAWILAGLLSATALAARSESDISYSLPGGRAWFDPVSGTITQCDAGVTAAVLPETISGARVLAIGENAFEDCANLASVTLPAGLARIGDWAFYNCGNLAAVTIPASVTAIGEGAFGNCQQLSGIYYAGSRAQWEAIEMGEFNAEFLSYAAINYNSGGQPTTPSTIVEILSAPTDGGGTLITPSSLARLSSVLISIRYSDSAARALTFLVSFYSADGRFLGNGMQDVQTDSGRASVSVPISAGISGAARMKVMVLESGRPLIPAETYSIA